MSNAKNVFQALCTGALATIDMADFSQDEKDVVSSIKVVNPASLVQAIMVCAGKNQAAVKELREVIVYFLTQNFPDSQEAGLCLRKGLGASKPACLNDVQVAIQPVVVQQQAQASAVEIGSPMSSDQESVDTKAMFAKMYPKANYQTTMKTVGEVFGLTTNRVVPVEVRHYPKGTPELVLNAIPKVNPNYKFTDSVMDVMNWLNGPGGRTLNLQGPAGCGKSELIAQVCARLNRPLFEIGCTHTTKPSDMLGSLKPVLQNGQMIFVYELGPIFLAYHYDGIVNLDEVDMLDPRSSNVLHRPMEAKPFFITQIQDSLTPSATTRIASTSNTALSGDTTGQFSGTKRQNLAFRTRIESIEMDYLHPWEEYEVLMKIAPGLNPANADSKPKAEARKSLAVALVNFAEATRAAYKAGTIGCPMTTRHLHWCAIRTDQNTKREGSIHVFDALYVTIMSMAEKGKGRGTASSSERDELMKMWQTFCPPSLYKQWKDREDAKKSDLATQKGEWDKFATTPYHTKP